MKTGKVISLFSAAIIATIILTGCAGSEKKESTGNYIDDTIITTRVKSALLGEKNISSTDISVETFKGRVQLSGFVSSEDIANKAVAVTKSVKGVQVVENDLILK
ncbi:BON domain-containing protein [Buttiauxella selenatireducens]|uniref:BON domain-containing protein n=1 Tax=Buttiauxella selenatireducens TaxID=3073902 RepID=A0ABY9S950_9ENTR|nr:BON domain-containing protein [Buttiauxella sp. R73]WMY72592.1 BON domain-containing protein [Buttiauxella sp. R73]